MPSRFPHMAHRRQKPIDVLTIPNYGPIEVAEVLHVVPQTIHYWISRESGLITPAQRRPPIMSFKNLVECYVLDIIRRIHKVSMPNVRFSVETLKALQRAKHLMSTDYPLADHDLKIDDKTKRLFVYDLHGRVVNLTAGGQIEVEEWIAACLKRVVRDKDGVARQFHPLLRRHHSFEHAAADPEFVVVDPRISFGKPVLINSAISTEVVAGRLIAGDPEKELANEYGRTLAEIRAAAEFQNVPINT
jgi:uncharacterized protein (DUF433 family)